MQGDWYKSEDRTITTVLWQRVSTLKSHILFNEIWVLFWYIWL